MVEFLFRWAYWRPSTIYFRSFVECFQPISQVCIDLGVTSFLFCILLTRTTQLYRRTPFQPAIHPAWSHEKIQSFLKLNWCETWKMTSWRKKLTKSWSKRFKSVFSFTLFSWVKIDPKNCHSCWLKRNIINNRLWLITFHAQKH